MSIEVSQLAVRAVYGRTRYVFVSGVLTRAARKHQPYGLGRGSLVVDHMIVRMCGRKHNAQTQHPQMGVSKLSVRIARPNHPNLSWLDDAMFLDTVIFPYNISYNSDGAETFMTDVQVGDSGYDQRIAHWDEPLMTYNVSYGVRTLEQLHALKKLFRAVKGKTYGFRFRDPMDYTSSFATGDDARTPDAITAFDQVIGTGDGLTKVFQLVKNYDFGGQPAKRTIYKTETGTVAVACNGVQYSGASFSVDDNTGLVTMASRDSITLGGNVTMTRGTANYRTIGWDDTTVVGTHLFVGDWVQVSGFANVSNRVPEAEAWQVTSINDTAKTIQFIIPAGHDTSLGVNETLTGNVTIAVIAAPPPGQQVTAGYQFHVPVRFDVDSLPISLDDYGIGSASQVKLQEIRDSL